MSQPLAGQLKDLQKLARGGQADDHQVRSKSSATGLASGAETIEAAATGFVGPSDVELGARRPTIFYHFLAYESSSGGFVAVGQSPSLYGKGRGLESTQGLVCRR